MKRKLVTELMPLKLQYFAEGDGVGTEGDGDGTGNAGGDGEGNTAGDETTPPTFDDFLKDTTNQAEFDRRVQKALTTALDKQKTKYETLMDDKVTEAEKLAKMSKDEKDAYQQRKREKELADREAAITRKELMAEAKNTLSDKKLPVSLAELLNYADASACSSSIDALEKAFNEAVAAGVEEMLKGSKPPKKAPPNEGITKEAFQKMGYAERLKLKTEQPELYKQLSGN